MNIIFLGLMYSDNSIKEAKICSKHGLQMAPHNFQTALIQGFKQIDNTNLFVLNVPPVGSFPFNYKKPFISSEKWDSNTQIGYLNLPCIKQFIQKRKLLRQAKKIISKVGTHDLCLVSYNTYEPFLEVLETLKRKYSDVKSCIIVTDCIPGRGDMDKYMTSKAKRAGDRIIKLAKSIDTFALLTKYLADELEIGNKPFVITECIAPSDNFTATATDGKQNICLYTGTLDTQFGICEIADAFAMLENAELWICGNGSGREYIDRMAKKYENIKYFGFINTEQLQEFRSKCDFLINPRRPSGTYTKYSFPSKTAEYMTSGKPTIMYKLEGIPDEYDKYLNYISGNTPSEIKDELQSIFSVDYDSLREKATEGRIFIVNNKSPKMQAQKIIDTIKGA